MPPTSSAPADPTWVATAPTGARLREIVGGYDIDRWPICVSRADGESLPGWLRRLAHRYGISPKAVLDEVGIPHTGQVQPDLPTLISAHPGGFTQAGLDPGMHPARCSVLGRALEELDQHYWSDVRYRRTRRWTRFTRYCPQCLAETGTWAETWSHPYHLACLDHRALLETRCPACQALPHDQPTWLTYDGPVDRCPHFIGPRHGRYRRRCATRLSQVPPAPATQEVIAAQQWLWDILRAGSNGNPITMVGLSVEAATAYSAAGEIITENTPEHPRERTLPEEHGLHLAHLILTQPSLPDAAHLAKQVKGFHPHNGVAPLGPQYKAAHRPRNPVAVAISLHQHQGRLALGSELKFRVGTSAPCYPHTWRVKTTPLTRAAALPELPLAWIPTTLWPGTLSLGDPSTDARFGLDTPLGRAFAAIALARFASTRPWRLLAVNLALPASTASTGARHWRALDQAGLWSAYAGAVAALFDQLHQHPPPIDYEHRRISAQPQAVTREARRTLTARPDLGLAQRLYTRTLWTTYTGADIAFAPAELTGSITTEHTPPLLEALQGSAAQLGKPAHEPLAWRPP